MYSPASSGGQEKYMKYVSFPWLPLEAALSLFNVTIFVKEIIFFWKKLIKTK
jgi:hypothetical protein